MRRLLASRPDFYPFLNQVVSVEALEAHFIGCLGLPSSHEMLASIVLVFMRLEPSR